MCGASLSIRRGLLEQDVATLEHGLDMFHEPQSHHVDDVFSAP
jgi:hypothetical protein